MSDFLFCYIRWTDITVFKIFCINVYQHLQILFNFFTNFIFSSSGMNFQNIFASKKHDFRVGISCFVFEVFFYEGYFFRFDFFSFQVIEYVAFSVKVYFYFVCTQELFSFFVCFVYCFVSIFVIAQNRVAYV